VFRTGDRRRDHPSNEDGPLWRSAYSCCGTDRLAYRQLPAAMWGGHGYTVVQPTSAGPNWMPAGTPTNRSWVKLIEPGAFFPGACRRSFRENPDLVSGFSHLPTFELWVPLP
jgi:hypothetical protein